MPGVAPIESITVRSMGLESARYTPTRYVGCLAIAKHSIDELLAGRFVALRTNERQTGHVATRDFRHVLIFRIESG